MLIAKRIGRSYKVVGTMLMSLMKTRSGLRAFVATLWRARSPRRDLSSRHSESGFTLVEILVVITIIGLVMGLVGPRVITYLSDSKVKTARIQIQGFSAALDLYYLDIGRYPTSSEGIAALVRKPDSATAWNGPYLKSNSVPNDPWGRPYVYKFPGEHGPYDIVSLGPEARESTTEATTSVTSWQQ